MDTESRGDGVMCVRIVMDGLVMKHVYYYHYY